MSLNDFVVNVFCETDDFMKELFPERVLRRSQVSDDLHVKKIRARHLWHLANRICRKILAHTFSVMFCLREKLSPLSLKKLISI